MPVIPEKYRDRIEAWRQKAKFFLQSSSLPGFYKVSIWDVGEFFFQEIRRDRIAVRAGAISFNFLLALFPSIIFLFTLIPYIPVQDLDRYLLNTLHEVLPESGFQFLESTITDIVSIKRGGLLSFGFLLAFFFATNGVNGLLLAFNKEHPMYRRRGMLRSRLAAFRLTFYLFFLFIVSILLIIAGDKVVFWFADKIGFLSVFSIILLSVIKWIVILLLFFTGISLIYYYGPTKRYRYKFLTPGGTFASIFSVLTSLGFGSFVNNFGLYNEVYGSIGTLIVLMIWMNLNSFVLILGFEINNSIIMNKEIGKSFIDRK
ncbi:MAG: YihY/virulence factor BrkB family protein [Chitinophagales bacterium]|nr:YihY/virulence factor BrkB family protein [Bacteroidota bacterium]